MNKVGIIAGSFDLIHPGYIYAFKQAKTQCNHLIVLLHTDPSLERPNKHKPILSTKERVEVLSSIKYIDEIIPYDTEKNLETLLKTLKYDIRFLGDDYKNSPITGDSNNVFYIDRSHGWSTTKFKKLIVNEK